MCLREYVTITKLITSMVRLSKIAQTYLAACVQFIHLFNQNIYLKALIENTFKRSICADIWTATHKW